MSADIDLCHSLSTCAPKTSFSVTHYIGRVRQKKDHPVHAHTSIIQALGLQSYILEYPTILLADSEDPDQAAWIHKLIWAFAVRICQKTFSHAVAQKVFSR